MPVGSTPRTCGRHPEFGPLVSTVPDDTPPRTDGRALQRLCKLQSDEYGARLHLEQTGDGIMLAFTEPVGDEAVHIAAHHYQLLISAWRSQGRRVIKLCDHCMSPFLLASSTKTRCPVCAKGSRTITLKIPFTALPRQRKTA